MIGKDNPLFQQLFQKLIGSLSKKQMEKMKHETIKKLKEDGEFETASDFEKLSAKEVSEIILLSNTALIHELSYRKENE